MNSTDSEHVFDLAITGGGVAGLSLAIRMQMEGWNVLLIEQHPYPKHKVCGEYISAEVIPYLKYLGIDLSVSRYPKINKLWLTVSSGREIRTDLKMGGIGISRFELDSMLANRAIESGVTIVHDTVNGLNTGNSESTISCRSGKSFRSEQVVFAHGKHGSPDRFLNRKPIADKQEYSGIKWHMKSDSWPDNLVALHNFHGGYAGISKVEDKWVNVCALVKTAIVREVQKPADIFNWVMTQNPHIATFMKTASPRWEKPLAIGAVHFKPKSLAENNVYMLGDAGGLIAPLTGNGMARAVRSSDILANVLLSAGPKKAASPEWRELYFSKMKDMQKSLPQARTLQMLFGKKSISESALTIAKCFPFLLKPIIAKTHGTPIPTPKT
jgi:menaquinone-9 beta-reductase